MQCSAKSVMGMGATPAMRKAGSPQNHIRKEGHVKGAPATTQFHRIKSPCTAQMNALLRIGDAKNRRPDLGTAILFFGIIQQVRSNKEDHLHQLN